MCICLAHTQKTPPKEDGELGRLSVQRRGIPRENCKGKALLLPVCVGIAVGIENEKMYIEASTEPGLEGFMKEQAGKGQGPERGVWEGEENIYPLVLRSRARGPRSERQILDQYSKHPSPALPIANVGRDH